MRERLTASREAGIRGTLAGQSLSFGRPSGAEPDVPAPEPYGMESGLGQADDDPLERNRGVTGREVIAGRSFALTDGGESVSVWGRGAHSRFDGRDGKGSLQGEVTTVTIGADWSSGRLIAGLSLSRSEGRGSYRLDDREDELDSSLTGLYPYLGYEVTDRFSVWGVVGYGDGGLTLTPEGGEGLETDLSLAMVAAGARGDLVPRRGTDGLALALEADALAVGTSTVAAEGLEAVEADASRLRVGLDGSMLITRENGRRLTPSLEIGLRQDGGDAETGFGVDAGIGLAWSDPARGISTEFSARGLIAHEAEGFNERGVSGAFSWDSEPSSDRGLSLSLRQTLGASASGGADALLGRETMGAGLDGGDDGDALSQRRLEVRLGYGFALSGGRFTGTPEVGFGLSNTDREASLGWRLGLERSDRLSFELGVEGTRRESVSDDRVPEHGIGFRMRARW